MTQVIDTMKDYTGDYNTYLFPDLGSNCLSPTCDTFIDILTALANALTSTTGCQDRIRANRVAFRFFGAYKRARNCKGTLQVVEMILSMLEASSHWFSCRIGRSPRIHGPNVAFVKLMEVRRDF